jgi:hypothetical protein
MEKAIANVNAIATSCLKENSERKLILVGSERNFFSEQANANFTRSDEQCLVLPAQYVTVSLDLNHGSQTRKFRSVT